MCSIGGSLRTLYASMGGGNVEIPPLFVQVPNSSPLPGKRTVSGG